MCVYETMTTDGGVPVKMWTRGVPVEETAREQLRKTAQMPFVFRHLAVMPDVHAGLGSTIGSVIPTEKAIIPAAVGVDIGCGMTAARTTLTAEDLPDSLASLRAAIEQAVPHGRVVKQGKRDPGTWGDAPPPPVLQAWEELQPGFEAICAKYPKIAKGRTLSHLGTLGTGNHFVEVCLDEADRVWIMLHSGSRGVGNLIGNTFIALAKEDMRKLECALPDQNMAYFPEETEHFADYVEAVGWAQRFAATNRAVMMAATLAAVRATIEVPFVVEDRVVDCHHNYVAREAHFGRDIWVTRKGAVHAGKGVLGIIPGSMGARSFIVRGRGQSDSFCSCSHGAGRVMSRTTARRTISLDQHQAALAHVECRKDEKVIDESPAAYKPIDAVMAAQRDLVEVVHTLHQVVCVKG